MFRNETGRGVGYAPDPQEDFSAPRNIWRRPQVQLAAAWTNHHHDELFDLPWPTWKIAQRQWGLSLADALRAHRMASADRNGGWQ